MSVCVARFAPHVNSVILFSVHQRFKSSQQGLQQNSGKSSGKLE
jgi:hypothetical protein